ncbi:hypothetical protein CMV_013117 [Castanea mollissima]|uniref:Uncharacterized protein n=1 Tax=Castanea mollissima TaxID=60419 RepID=A0A8J4VMA7_9ROSI|nr:hypothetical protein CMV_013117 [Castanea mollissima]
MFRFSLLRIYLVNFHQRYQMVLWQQRVLAIIIVKKEEGRDGGHRLSVRSTQRIRQGQRPPRQTLPQTRPQRVHQGGFPYGHRVCGYGVRWLLRQAHLHPHQQHHRWLLLMSV